MGGVVKLCNNYYLSPVAMGLWGLWIELSSCHTVCCSRKERHSEFSSQSTWNNNNGVVYGIRGVEVEELRHRMRG